MDQIEQLRAALGRRYLIDREIGRGGMACVYRAHALGYAHSHNIAHRDVKPANIMLSGHTEPGSPPAAWHALVTDFGVARAISVAAGEQLTATGIVVGTPEYMSPEQASGDQGID